MAAIEKICEFSDSCPEPPWLMYDYKRHHIQIKPEYRKLFKGAKAVLIITDKEKFSLDKKYGSYFLDQEPWPGHRLATRVDYCLVVLDEHLQGRVQGCYHNSSFYFGKVKRKLSKMVGYKLPVIDVSNHQVAYDDDLLKAVAMKERLLFDPGNAEIYLSKLLIDSEMYVLSVCFDCVYLKKSTLKAIRDVLLTQGHSTFILEYNNHKRILEIKYIGDGFYSFNIYVDNLFSEYEHDTLHPNEVKALTSYLSKLI